MSPEEATLVAAGPEFVAMIALLRTKYHGQAQRAVRRLHTLFLDYPTPVLRSVLADAIEPLPLSELRRSCHMRAQTLGVLLVQLARDGRVIKTHAGYQLATR